MLIAPPSADLSKLRRSDMPPHRGSKPSGTLAGYHHAAPTALDSRASRGEGDQLPHSLVLSFILPTCQQAVARRANSTANQRGA
jgi:hypothetical protein